VISPINTVPLLRLGGQKNSLKRPLEVDNKHIKMPFTLEIKPQLDRDSNYSGPPSNYKQEIELEELILLFL